MGLFQLQGCLGIFKPMQSSRHISKYQSSFILAIIVLMHVSIILLVFNEKIKQQRFVPEKSLHMINLLQESKKTMPYPDRPDFIEPLRPQFNTPPLHFAEPVLSSLDVPPDESPYKLPSESSGQYENVFDPRLRQKLLDAKRFNVQRAAEKSRTWTEIDGRTFIEMGDGVCMVSMQKVDSRDRGTKWGFTTCGKTNSEQAMDRVMADFESRKQPKKNQ